MSSTSFVYIAEAISKGIDNKFNPNIAKAKNIKFKKIKIDDIEETDFTGMKFHKFSKFNCSFSVQMQASKQKDGTRRNTQLIDTGKKTCKIRIPIIGLTNFKYHRCIPSGSKFDQVTISKKSDGWHIALCGLEYTDKPKVELNKDSKFVGIDLNTDNNFVCSDGSECKNPKEKIKKLDKQIKKSQKCLSRRVYGSKNYQKALCKINKLYEKKYNIKKHELHNMSKKVIMENDAVILEDLNVKGMQKYNGAMVQKNNFYEFNRQIEYKAELYGKHTTKVGRYYASSQICSKCGTIHTEMKNLRKREFKCECGNIMKRDLNAAINICEEGKRLLLNNENKNNDKK
jgi:putative transposase